MCSSKDPHGAIKTEYRQVQLGCVRTWERPTPVVDILYTIAYLMCFVCLSSRLLPERSPRFCYLVQSVASIVRDLWAFNEHSRRRNGGLPL